MRRVAVALLGLATATHADGLMVASIGEAVASPKQEAVLRVEGDRVTVTLRTHFRRGPEELGWVIPVPAEPEEVGVADGAALDDLDRATSPTFFAYRRKSWGCGCAGGRAGEASLGVEVTATGTAGIYDWASLSATDASGLETWLRDNGFTAPAGAARVFERYVERGWRWLALKLRAGAGAEASLAPQPIRYSYRSRRVIFPLAISRPSAAERNEILLYVASSKRFVAANWANVEIDRSRIVRDRASPSGTNYEALFLEATDASGGRAFVTEYAGRHRLRHPGALDAGLFVTRLRAVVSRDAMDGDVELRPAATDDVLSNRFFLYAASRAPFPGDALLAVAGLWLLRRHRTRHRRRASDRYGGTSRRRVFPPNPRR